MQASWWFIPRHRPLATAAVAILLILAAVGGLMWWLNARQYESTDDAFIDARMASVSSQVNGAIVDVPVTDNQLVDAGAVLARIDDRDYRVAVNQAKAQVDQAQATITNLDAQIDAQQARNEQAEKQVAEAQATLTFAREEDVRAQDLVCVGARARNDCKGAGGTAAPSGAAWLLRCAMPAAAGKRHRQLRQGRAARAGQDRLRRHPGRLSRPRDVGRA